MNAKNKTLVNYWKIYERLGDVVFTQKAATLYCFEKIYALKEATTSAKNQRGKTCFQKT